MQTVQVEVLTHEEQVAKQAAIMAANEQRDRDRVAAKNRSAGHKKPEPGDRLYVTTMRGIARRGRSGIRFSQEARTELLVVDNDPDKRGDVPSAAVTVTVDGAEAILHDDALNVSGRPATEAEASDLRSQLEARDAELATVRAELAAARREARQAATPDPQGGPARLRAQRKVPGSDPDGFGGKD